MNDANCFSFSLALFLSPSLSLSQTWSFPQKVSSISLTPVDGLSTHTHSHTLSPRASQTRFRFSRPLYFSLLFSVFFSLSHTPSPLHIHTHSHTHAHTHTHTHTHRHLLCSSRE